MSLKIEFDNFIKKRLEILSNLNKKVVIQNIPQDIFEYEIFKYLDQSELGKMKLVSKKFNYLVEKKFEKKYQQIKNNYNDEQIQFTERATNSSEEKLKILKVFDFYSKIFDTILITDDILEFRKSGKISEFILDPYLVLGKFEESKNRFIKDKIILEYGNILSTVFKYFPIEHIFLKIVRLNRKRDAFFNKVIDMILKNKFHHLKTLNITNIQLFTFDVDPKKMPSLERLSIVNCDLKLLTDKISDFKNLKGLYLSKNKLTSLPESITKLKTLEDLDIRNNEIKYIPKLKLKNLLKKDKIKDK